MPLHWQKTRNGERYGEMKIDIRRKSGRNVPPQKNSIIKLVDAELDKLTTFDTRSSWRCKRKPRIIPPKTTSWADTIFTVSYKLSDGEQFCDTTIEIARAVFTALGVHDKNKQYLALFSLHQETFVLIEDSWISFTKWLRISHLLSIFGPEDFEFEKI